MHKIGSITSCGPNRWPVPQISVHGSCRRMSGTGIPDAGSNIEVGGLIMHALM
ncbi:MULTISPECIES: hypothetical protein [Nocardioides]|uniref:Uncharacterized protein n=1 Tax=Nocardioides vastitatis TaxID=2568655 RepID=A0ABW0ZMC9_9ACTN|nr:hypothetical protein [Nocardioides sp.]